MGTLEDSPHPQFLLLSITLLGMECLFGPFMSAVLAVSAPNFLPTVCLVAGVGAE